MDFVVVCIAFIAALVAGVWWWSRRPRVTKRLVRARAPAVDTKGTLALDFYLDERCHTGDLVFKDSHVALVVMHPVSGEPWLLEADHSGGVQTLPGRTLLQFEGDLSVFTIGRPLNATNVLRAASAAEAQGPMTCSQFAAHVLRQLDVLQCEWRRTTPHTLALQADLSSRYNGPFDLE